MAEIKWVQLGIKHCERVGKTVELMEKRVYPSGLLQINHGEYRVMTHKCSAGYECTHLENPCVWVDKEGDGCQYNV